MLYALEPTTLEALVALAGRATVENVFERNALHDAKTALGRAPLAAAEAASKDDPRQGRLFDPAPFEV